MPFTFGDEISWTYSGTAGQRWVDLIKHQPDQILQGTEITKHNKRPITLLYTIIGDLKLIPYITEAGT